MVETMARPKLPEDEKRQLHSFRLDPADRKAVQEAAEAEGLSFPAAAEKYIKAGLSLYRHPLMDENLTSIFADILDEMQEVQRRNNDKPWFKDLTTWAACKMIFAKGPFARRNPDDWKNVPAISALWSRVSAARQSKQEAINLLEGLGVRVSPEKMRDPIGRRGLFGNANRNTLLAPTDMRISERRAIDAVEDNATREQAVAIFGIVEKLDADEAEAMKQWYNQVQNYTEAEKEGVELYKDWRREVVKQQLARGEFPSLEDFY